MVKKENQLQKITSKLKKGSEGMSISKKTFGIGMYKFSMFMINYYSRVRINLNLDYDSFIIVLTVVSHTLYNLNKKKSNFSYEELGEEWLKISKNTLPIHEDLGYYFSQAKYRKLSIASISLVSSQPKETVRRKIGELVKKNLLKNSKINGILLGSQYERVFKEFVPITVEELTKLIKFWKKTGSLDELLKF